MEQYRNNGIDNTKAERTPEKRDSISEIVGRSRTGTNVRELVMGGGSKRESIDVRRKDSGVGSGSSSENERRPVIRSAKGTGFDEPFCKCKSTCSHISCEHHMDFPCLTPEIQFEIPLFHTPARTYHQMPPFRTK